MRDAQDESGVAAGAGKHGCAPSSATAEELEYTGQQLADLAISAHSQLRLKENVQGSG